MVSPSACLCLSVYSNGCLSSSPGHEGSVGPPASWPPKFHGVFRGCEKLLISQWLSVSLSLSLSFCRSEEGISPFPCTSAHPSLPLSLSLSLSLPPSLPRQSDSQTISHTRKQACMHIAYIQACTHTCMHTFVPTRMRTYVRTSVPPSLPPSVSPSMHV